MFQIGLKKFFVIKKVKKYCALDMSLVILKAKKLLERFTKKNCKKENVKTTGYDWVQERLHFDS